MLNPSFFPSPSAMSALPDVNVMGNNPMTLAHPGVYNFGNMTIAHGGCIIMSGDNIVLYVTSLNIIQSQTPSEIGCDIFVRGTGGINGTGGTGQNGPVNVSINIQNSVTGQLVLLNEGDNGVPGNVTINCPKGSLINATCKDSSGLLVPNTGKVTINYH
jgi:hypothetical protein